MGLQAALWKIMCTANKEMAKLMALGVPIIIIRTREIIQDLAMATHSRMF